MKSLSCISTTSALALKSTPTGLESGAAYAPAHVSEDFVLIHSLSSDPVQLRFGLAETVYYWCFACFSSESQQHKENFSLLKPDLLNLNFHCEQGDRSNIATPIEYCQTKPWLHWLRTKPICNGTKSFQTWSPKNPLRPPLVRSSNVAVAWIYETLNVG